MRIVFEKEKNEDFEKLLEMTDNGCDKYEIEKMIYKIAKKNKEEYEHTLAEENSGLGGFFEKQQYNEICGCDDEIILRMPERSDFKKFIELKKEYTLFLPKFGDDKYIDALWNEFTLLPSMNFSIIRKDDNEFLGYCGIKDVRKEVWEIVIELRKMFCGKGIGSKSLKMMIDRIEKVTNRSKFICKVMSDNYASHHLMDKIGFVPAGLGEYMFYDKETTEKIEDKYKYLIDDSLMKVAEKFNVDAKKLLSHIVIYKTGFADQKRRNTL